MRRFVEEAVQNGTIRRFAIAQGTLAANGELESLDNAQVTHIIQEWVYTTGVGVDCSGFVLQALIRAREAVRAELTALGVPANQVPTEVSHQERSARSFRDLPRVPSPTSLRPGDAWVVHAGGHIRIVVDVRQTTLANGRAAVEFDTAESAGGSTSSRTGQVRRTWQTRNLQDFRGLEGSFHRMR